MRLERIPAADESFATSAERPRCSAGRSSRDPVRARSWGRDAAQPAVRLADALDLVLLIGDQRPDKFGRAAARWRARYILELRDVDLIEAQLVASALAGLRAKDPRPAALTLRSLAQRRRMTETEAVLVRWLEKGTGH